MKQLIDQSDCILIEAAIVERLRRNSDIELDARLVHAPLIYSKEGRQALGSLYKEYIDIAESGNLPLLLGTPTWRASRDRVLASACNRDVNTDAVKYMQALVAEIAPAVPVRIGGIIGCKNDCYLPDQALSVEEAKAFHGWQIDQLAAAGADYLMAVTLPSAVEAAGIALAMERSGLPYLISFVVGVDGKLLDGTDIDSAISHIDALTSVNPLGYFVNCSYPSFLNAARQPAKVFERLIGLQANASSLGHEELEGAAELKAESLAEWGDLMVQLNRDYGLKVLGGCCGTSGAHLHYLSSHLTRGKDLATPTV